LPKNIFPWIAKESEAEEIAIVKKKLKNGAEYNP
jgi:hypothetical protein